MNFLGQNLWQHRGGSRFENWPKRNYLSVESEQAITDTGKIQQLFDQLCLNLCVALNNVYAMRQGTLISAPVFDQSGPADDRVGECFCASGGMFLSTCLLVCFTDLRLN